MATAPRPPSSALAATFLVAGLRHVRHAGLTAGSTVARSCSSGSGDTRRCRCSGVEARLAGRAERHRTGGRGGAAGHGAGRAVRPMPPRVHRRRRAGDRQGGRRPASGWSNWHLRVDQVWPSRTGRRPRTRRGRAGSWRPPVVGPAGQDPAPPRRAITRSWSPRPRRARRPRTACQKSKRPRRAARPGRTGRSPAADATCREPPFGGGGRPMSSPSDSARCTPLAASPSVHRAQADRPSRPSPADRAVPRARRAPSSSCRRSSRWDSPCMAAATTAPQLAERAVQPIERRLPATRRRRGTATARCRCPREEERRCSVMPRRGGAGTAPRWCPRLRSAQTNVCAAGVV